MNGEIWMYSQELVAYLVCSRSTYNGAKLEIALTSHYNTLSPTTRDYSATFTLKFAIKRAVLSLKYFEQFSTSMLRTLYFNFIDY